MKLAFVVLASIASTVLAQIPPTPLASKFSVPNSATKWQAGDVHTAKWNESLSALEDAVDYVVQICLGKDGRVHDGIVLGQGIRKLDGMANLKIPQDIPTGKYTLISLGGVPPVMVSPEFCIFQAGEDCQ
ncbi:hypothetical protein HGRIS_011822 [Hohenbuehelia grisea]|uniref:Uncharacterized protein n=1 Tax=Hohenbuehelia grisea TaxID=104357 RepID=A0ABR3JY06_9AGAR